MSKVSAIIPTRNEEKNLAATVESLRNPLVSEIIVVDGGSDDRTPELARELGCRVVGPVAGGRAAQMNRGAAESQGRVLLFLHADTLVPALSLKRMCIAMGSEDSFVGGGFTRRFDTRSPLLALTTRLAGLRSRMFGIFLGDQGIFVRRDAFDLLGGFDEQMGPGEDIDLCVRMRRLGRTVTISPPVLTSARRFEEKGPWRQTRDDWKAGRRILAESRRRTNS